MILNYSWFELVQLLSGEPCIQDHQITKWLGPEGWSWAPAPTRVRGDQGRVPSALSSWALKPPGWLCPTPVSYRSPCISYRSLRVIKCTLLQPPVQHFTKSPVPWCRSPFLHILKKVNWPEPAHTPAKLKCLQVKQRLRLMMTTGRVTRAKHSILERKLLRVHTRLLSCFDGEHRFSSAVNCCHTTHKYSLLQLCSKVQICLWCWERVDETIALFDLSFLSNTERTNWKEKKETRWGWSFLLKGWAESTASSQRKHRGRKPQQSQEILGSPSWSDLRSFGHWRLLSSSPRQRKS